MKTQLVKLTPALSSNPFFIVNNILKMFQSGFLDKRVTNRILGDGTLNDKSI